MFTHQCNRQARLVQLHLSLVCKFQLSKKALIVSYVNLKALNQIKFKSINIIYIYIFFFVIC